MAENWNHDTLELTEKNMRQKQSDYCPTVAKVA